MDALIDDLRHMPAVVLADVPAGGPDAGVWCKGSVQR
jgi:hypothetical protein